MSYNSLKLPNNILNLMVRKIRLRYLKILLVLFTFTTRNSVKSDPKLFEEIGSGLSEKGIYLDFIKVLNPKKKLGIRINYLPKDFFTHKNIYVENRNITADYFGIGLLYQHNFLQKESKSNFYFQGNAEFSNLNLSHEIDLTKETYSYRNLSLTCSACGNLTIQTDPEKIYFIPSAYLGYKYKNTKNFHTNISLGIQYISPAQLENFTDTEYPLPSYVQTKIDEWMNKTQDLVDSYNKIQPSINVGFSYIF